MDKVKAKQLEKELSNQELSGYRVLSYINCGKSAAVFKAEKNGINYALKIFDNELVERFGHKIQELRIEQEIGLRGHKIDNLVKIEDGGNAKIAGNTYHFLVMEYIEGKNLKEYIETNKYNEAFVISTFKTLYNITKALLMLEKPIVHRDIKPENIMVDKNEKIILMDLGVLKFIGAKSISDGEEKQFVGTLRYAPPEFLLREEEDSNACWNAVNLYQIGGVLHDLTQRKELFFDKIPYPKLVLAIKEDPPTITKNEYSTSLIQLTRNLLCKDWKQRNQLCSEDVIAKFNSSITSTKTKLNAQIEELQSMSLDHQSALNEVESIRRSTHERQELRKNIADKTLPILIKCFKFFVDNKIAKGYKHSTAFSLETDISEEKNFKIRNYLFALTGDNSMGYSDSVIFLIRAKNDEKYFVDISIIGLIPPQGYRDSNFQNPSQDLRTIFNDIYRNQYQYSLQTIELMDVFQGIIDFNDASYLEESICNIIAEILKIAKTIMKPAVEKNIAYQKRIAEGHGGIHMTTFESRRAVLINKLLS